MNTQQKLAALESLQYSAKEAGFGSVTEWIQTLQAKIRVLERERCQHV